MLYPEISWCFEKKSPTRNAANSTHHITAHATAHVHPDRNRFAIKDAHPGVSSVTMTAKANPTKIA
jgi:hypothetical protein